MDEEETSTTGTSTSFAVGDRVVLQGDVNAAEGVTRFPASAGCNVCGSVDNLQTCSACRTVKYCCREHQKEDWTAHKKICKERAGRRLYYSRMHGTVAVVPTSSTATTGVSSSDSATAKGGSGYDSGGGGVVDAVIVDLDLSQERIKVPLHLLEREAPLPEIQPLDDVDHEHPMHRAAVCNGALIESEGRAIDLALNCLRTVTASQFMGESSIQSPMDIINLKQQRGTQGLVLVNQITSMSWSFWRDGRGFHGNAGKGTYHHLRTYLVEQCYEQGGPEAQSDPPLKRAVKAVDALNAVKGWGVRVHGCFWVVGMDDDGTWLVSDVNRSMVYQCVGVRDAIYPMVQRTHPKDVVLMTVTMIPWYGRLVYDGVLAPPPGMTQPMVAPPGLARRLKLQVDLARREGRVISRLAQLEVPGGSDLGLHDLVAAASNPDFDVTKGGVPAESTEQKPPTEKEKLLLERLAKVPKISDVDVSNPLEAIANHKVNAYWVFRRMAYTEVDNPNHMGLIVSNTSECIGPFSCSTLVPSSVDILTALLKYSKRLNLRPAVVGIDDIKCMERCKFLLENNVDGTTAFYYAPPTPEETDAAMISNLSL